MAESYSIQAVLSAVDQNFTSTLKDAEGTTEQLGDGMDKTNTSILDIAKGVGVFKLVEMGVSAVTSSVGDAIDRFDTLNQYPKVLESLGASAEDAESGMNILSDGIDGLPTSLDEVAGTAQQMFLVFRDADQASESTIALNNALLASGSSGDKAARGTEQYLKMLRSGKVDMDVWMTLQDTMGIGLDKVAKSMLGTEASTQDLYKALQSGEVSIDDFNGKLVEMSDELGQLARVNTEGIGTSFKNMKSAVTKGLANIIKAIDNFVRDAGINAKGIAGVFDDMKAAINMSFDAIIASIEMVTPAFASLLKAVETLTPALKIMTPIVIGLAAAYGTLKVIGTIDAMMGGLTKATVASNIATAAYDKTMKSAEKSTILFKVAQMGVQGVATLVTAVINGLKTAQQLLAGQTTIGAIAQTGFAGATALASSAVKGLYAALGPVGIVMGVVAAATAILVKITNDHTKASKELKKAQDDMKTSLEESSESYDKNIGKIRAQTEVNQQLRDEVVDLAIQENKSAETKELLKTKVDELNSKIQGLGLAYNEEADGITMSNEQLQKRLDLQEKQEMGNAAEERLIELQQKRTEAVENLKNAEAAQIDVQSRLWTWGKEIKNTEDALTTAKENRNNIEEQIAQATVTRNEGLKASAEELQLVQNQMVEQQKVNYEDMTESQQKAFDSMKAQYDSLREKTTSAFDAIEQKQTISLEQMVENLNKNAEAVQAWSNNVATLAERGVDQGLIAQLEKMGPAGAQQAAELVNRSDAELQQLSVAYSENVKSANEAMVRTAGENSQPFVDEMANTVNKASVSSKTAFENSDLFTLGGKITGTIKSDIEKGSGDVSEASKQMVSKATEPIKDLQPKFYDSGKETGTGLAKGINENTDVAGKASEKMGNTVDEQLRSSLGIQSPSRVMVENGKFITSGLAKGIEDGKNSPLNIIKELSSQIPNEFENLPNDLKNIGSYAMQGFAEGINESGNDAISNANRIANDVAETMRKALDVHSPSRVMMEIGGFVGEGLAIGIEKSSKLVRNATRAMSQEITSISDSDNPFSNNGYGFSNAIEVNESNNKPLYVTVESVLDGRVVAKETAPFMATELQNIGNKRNTSMGRR